MTGAGGGGQGAGVSTAPTPAERGALPTRLSRPLPHGLGATRYGQPRAQDSVYEAPTLTSEVSNGTDRQRAGPKPAGRGVDGRRPLCGRLLPQPWRSPRRMKGEDLAARGAARRPRPPAVCGAGRHSRPPPAGRAAAPTAEHALGGLAVASQDGGTMRSRSAVREEPARVSGGPSHRPASPDAPRAGARTRLLSSPAVPAPRPWPVRVSLLPDATWAAHPAARGPASAGRFSSRPPVRGGLPDARIPTLRAQGPVLPDRPGRGPVRSQRPDGRTGRTSPRLLFEPGPLLPPWPGPLLCPQDCGALSLAALWPC